jgi:hypothetical protein
MVRIADSGSLGQGCCHPERSEGSLLYETQNFDENSVIPWSVSPQTI